MSTLKKNKRIKRAAQVELYGDLKPGRGHKKVERGKAKYLGVNGRKTTGITKRVLVEDVLRKLPVVEPLQEIRHPQLPVCVLAISPLSFAFGYVHSVY